MLRSKQDSKFAEMSSEPVPWQKDEDDQRSTYFNAFAERQMSRGVCTMLYTPVCVIDSSL